MTRPWRGVSAHGGVDAHPAPDGGHRGTVAQMADDEVRFATGAPEECGRASGHVAVAGAVESVAPDVVRRATSTGWRTCRPPAASWSGTPCRRRPRAGRSGAAGAAPGCPARRPDCAGARAGTGRRWPPRRRHRRSPARRTARPRARCGARRRSGRPAQMPLPSSAAAPSPARRHDPGAAHDSTARPPRPRGRAGTASPIRSTRPRAVHDPSAGSTTRYFRLEDPVLMTRTALTPDPCWAWMAVMATVLTMSGTVQPRDRSLTGRRRPWSTGPIATASAERCTALYVVLPVLRSGKTSTVACPATGLPGIFDAPTAGSTAASYWIGPASGRSGRSDGNDGRRAHLLDVDARARRARRVRHHRHPRHDAERRAVSALRTAISASCSAVGSRLTAQSANASTRSGRHMRKALDTSDASGVVRSSRAPAGSSPPWCASRPTPCRRHPVSTRRVPKYDGSRPCRARLERHPLVGAQSRVPRGELDGSSDVAGSMISMPVMSTPRAACARDLRGSPSSTRSTTRPCSSSSAARRMRSSSPPAARSACARHARARGRRRRTSAASRHRAEAGSARRAARCRRARRTRRAPPRSCAGRPADLAAQALDRVERRVRVGVDRHHRQPRRPSSCCVIGSGRRPRSARARRRRHVGAQANAAIATPRSARSPEATSSTPVSAAAARSARGRSRRRRRPPRAAGLGLPTSTSPPSPSATSSTVSADSTGRSGSTHTGASVRARRPAGPAPRSTDRRIDAVDEGGDERAAVPREQARRRVHGASMPASSRSCPLTTASTGVPMLAASVR